MRGFWLKISKIVTYKQKVDVDAIRRKGMDKQLVFLVQQTEKYSSSLASQMDNEEVSGGVERQPACQPACLVRWP